MDTQGKVHRKPNPRASSNIISTILFLYMIPIFTRAYKKGFREDDLFEHLDEDDSHLLGKELEATWKRYNKRHKKWSLHLTLFKHFGLKFFLCGLILFIKETVLIVFIPHFIGRLVAYLSQTTEEITPETANWYAGGLITCMLFERLVSHPTNLWSFHLTMKMRIACTSLIYRKILRLSKTALARTTVGHIITLITNDLNRFETGFDIAHYVWISPIQAALVITLLYMKIGSACLIGVGILLIIQPMQWYMARVTARLRLRIAKKTDERVRLMNEIISGIQVIKMYTWEKPFAKLIEYVRSKETKAIRLQHMIYALSDFEMYACRLAIYFSLVCYYLMGEQIDAETVFTIVSIFEVSNYTITSLMEGALRSTAESHVALTRVNNFLNNDELAQKALPSAGPDNVKCNGFEDHRIPELPKPVGVILNNVCAKWDVTSTDYSLKDINLNLTQPQLCAIIGPVGSGKTSLFNVILKELPIVSGTMQVTGKISYSSQEPWLFSGSVRQNILFGDAYDEKRYQRVCKVCTLDVDFRQLPFGDKTLVGEKGKVLSGGQKARINLARCIYKKADIYLLDDPLSAVDTNVGQKLFHDCIRTFLQDKICILITHQLQYLKSAHHMLILDDGLVLGTGTFDELQTSGLDFAQLLGEMSSNEENELIPKSAIKRQISVASEKSEAESMDEMGEEPILEKEKLTSGVVSKGTYLQYLHAGGNYFVLTLLLMAFMAFHVISSTTDYFLTYWVNSEQDFLVKNISLVEQEAMRKIFVYEYTALTIASIAGSNLHMYFYYVILTRASINLHNKIFNQLMRATMRFFNTNLSGRILNRFSEDLGIIDEYLPIVICQCTTISMMLIGIIILTSAMNPLLLPPALVLVEIFYLVRIVFINTSRSVKRIEGIVRSPILQHVTATLNGLSTIRAFSAEELLINEFNAYQNTHTSASLLFNTSTSAFSSWLDIICTLFISLVTVLLLIRKDMRGGDLGLIITQYFGLMGSIQYAMSEWSELENNMTSVERILEYTELEKEPVRENKTLLPANWPIKGKLEFRGVYLQYMKTELTVLTNINFVINPGEKIGIVGRTGAGKTSIITALFQLYEVEGAILIDDVDITNLPLELARSHISIIPQEPILFAATMRKNLDPFDQYDDEALWSALEQVELKEMVNEMPHGLQANISEGGSNCSVGQRQLVCLARAILHNNRILVLDEATANVDLHTDALIQKTVRKMFANCTVLTIAHRLHTVMDSDKILVMDKGQIQEFDSPHKLMQNKNGALATLVDMTGPSTARILREIAEKASNGG